MPNKIYLDDIDDNIEVPKHKSVFAPGKLSDINKYNLEKMALGMLRDIESIVKGNLKVIQQLLQSRLAGAGVFELKQRMEKLFDFFAECQKYGYYSLESESNNLEMLISQIIDYGNELQLIYSNLANHQITRDIPVSVCVNHRRLTLLLKDFFSLVEALKILQKEKASTSPLVLSTPLKTDLYNGLLFSNRTEWALKEEKAAVPHKLHRIWMGSKLPPQYFENILSLRKLDPQQKIYLWSFDPQVLHKAIAAAHYDLPQKHLIKIRDIEKELFPLIFTHFPPSIAAEIIRIVRVESVGASNFATVSDIIRLVVLYVEGGRYADTDLYATIPQLTNLSALSKNILDKTKEILSPSEYDIFVRFFDIDFRPLKCNPEQSQVIEKVLDGLELEAPELLSSVELLLSEEFRQCDMFPPRAAYPKPKPETEKNLGWGHIKDNNCYIYSLPRHPLTYQAIMNLLVNYQHLESRMLVSVLPGERKPKRSGLLNFLIHCQYLENRMFVSLLLARKKSTQNDLGKSRVAKLSLFSMLDVKRLTNKSLPELKYISEWDDQCPSRLRLTIFTGVRAVTSTSRAIADHSLGEKVIIKKDRFGFISRRIEDTNDVSWIRKNKAAASYSYDTLAAPKLKY